MLSRSRERSPLSPDVGTRTALQGAIVLLDSATMWTLIRALGVAAPAGDIFASFMIASLFRTMGIVPGGCGYLDASLTATILDMPQGIITRAMGDVHPCTRSAIRTTGSIRRTAGASPGP